MRPTCALGLALAFAAAVPAQTQPNPARTTSYPDLLYRQEDVARSLRLNEKQVGQLNDMTAKLQGRYNTEYDKLGTLAEKDRLARTQELNRQYMNDWAAGTKGVFDDTQAARYRQLQMQYGGFSSLNDPDVQKRLNLTEEQRNNLRGSVDWSAQQMADINKLGATDREKAMQMYGDYRKQYDERFNKFLTPDQMKAYRELAGEPYQFQPNFTPRRVP